MCKDNNPKEYKGIERDRDRNFEHRSKERPEPPKGKGTLEFLKKKTKE